MENILEYFFTLTTEISPCTEFLNYVRNVLITRAPRPIEGGMLKLKYWELLV